jgi:hypothetical protein
MPSANGMLMLQAVDPSTGSDPIGIANELQTCVTNLEPRISGPEADPLRARLKQSCHQIAEASSILAASQLIIRRTVLLHQTGSAYRNDDSDNDDRKGNSEGGGMMIDSKPISMSSPTKDSPGGIDEATILGDLEEDWKGIINGASPIGDRQFGAWCEQCLEKAFAADE